MARSFLILIAIFDNLSEKMGSYSKMSKKMKKMMKKMKKNNSNQKILYHRLILLSNNMLRG